jgi:hypothetical protein
MPNEDHSGRTFAGPSYDRDLSHLEKVLSYTTAIVTYMRFITTELWAFYWAVIVFVPLLLLIIPAYWISLALGYVPEAGDDTFHFFYVISYSLGIAAFFTYAGIKAVFEYSKTWSIVAFIVCCYEIYSLRDLLIVAWQLRQTLPYASLDLDFSAGLTFSVYVCFLASFWRIWGLSDDQRRTCFLAKEVKFFPRKALRRLTYIPETIDLVKSRKLLTTIVIFLGASFAFAVPYNLGRAADVAVRALHEARQSCDGKPDEASCLEAQTKAGFWTLILGLPAAVIFCALTGRKLLALGARRISWSIADFPADAQPFVVFLRSFREDRVKVRPSPLWFIGKLIALGQPAKTLDEIVLDEASPYGRVVALGNPDDKRTPYGAARGYVSNEEWQPVVRDLLEKAQLVISCIDDSEGIRWELDYILNSAIRSRCLFLLTPRLSALDQNQAMLADLFPMLTSPKRNGPAGEIGNREWTEGKAVVGFFVESNAGYAVGRSDHVSTASYTLMLRWFLHSRMSG